MIAMTAWLAKELAMDGILPFLPQPGKCTGKLNTTGPV